MADIDFNQPSVGQVNSTKVALEIKNNGSGGCLKCISPGTSNSWVAVWGETASAAGVVGLNKSSWVGVHGISTGVGGHGVIGEVQHTEGGAGVIGTSKSWIGTYGESNTSTGVYGKSNTWAGVWGESQTAAGVVGLNKSSWVGVHGISTGVGGHGVIGEVQHTEGGAGVIGKSIKWIGVYGESQKGHGVWGETKDVDGGAGVVGKSINWVGVYGESQTKIGVWGKAPLAGLFEGNVEVTGELQVTKDIMLMNADCAEEFDIVEENVEPGTVMVLNEMGSLEPSYQEYDKKVAGIISGARGYKPAIVLDRQNQNENEENMYKERRPIALMGKVYCKVDARNSSVEIGDLLTTSPTKGHAMKAKDPMKAFGAVIGKALGSIKQGLGMIPVLVTLQ